MNKAAPRQMLLVAPMQIGEMAGFTPQRQQIGRNDLASGDYDEYLIQGGPAFTVRDSSGDVLCFAGLIEQWEGRALAWAILSDECGDYMLSLTRAIGYYLRNCKYRRVEAYIDECFPQAHRWARLLGFECETPKPMRNFYPNGNSAFMYVRTYHG